MIFSNHSCNPNIGVRGRIVFVAMRQIAPGKVNALHRKITHIRNDFLHQTTTAISKNHAVVVIEDLKVRNMSKSAAGTKENPA